MDAVLAATVGKIISDHQHSTDALWNALQTQALTQVLLDTDDIHKNTNQATRLCASDYFGLMQLYGSTTVVLPLCEHLLANWLLNVGGIPAPEGRLLFCHSAQITSDADIRVLESDSCGALADYVVWLDHEGTQNQITLARVHSRVDTASALLNQTVSATLTAPDPQQTTPSSLDSASVNAMGALMRACQMNGAMSRVLELSLQHAQERKQFGRTLGKFQAIQHLLSAIAAECAASSAAVNKAIDGFNSKSLVDPEFIAIAKIRTSEAVQIVTANAHQIHGALGYTQEYALANYSHRLWQWRDDYGCEYHWSEFLGRRALADRENQSDTEKQNRLVNALLGEINE